MRTREHFTFWKELICIDQVGRLVPRDEDVLTLFNSWRQRMGGLEEQHGRRATKLFMLVRVCSRWSWLPFSRQAFLPSHAIGRLHLVSEQSQGEINALFIPTAKVVHEDWDLQLRRSNPHVFCKLQTFACMNNAPGARMTRDRLREPCYAEG